VNKQIAAELGLSLVTVKVHRGQVMRKMRAKSVAELVRMADRLGRPAPLSALYQGVRAARLRAMGRGAGRGRLASQARGEMPEGPLVAIVDDDKSIRNATQDLLKAAGFSTATFEDAESFLGSASRASCGLRGRRHANARHDGRQAVSGARRSGHAIPTCHYHGPPGRTTQARAREAGITCYLIKPFTPDELLECVAKRSRSRSPARYTKVLSDYPARQSPDATAQYVYLVTMARRSACA
jgi:Response regulator